MIRALTIEQFDPKHGRFHTQFLPAIQNDRNKEQISLDFHEKQYKIDRHIYSVFMNLNVDLHIEKKSCILYVEEFEY